MSIHNLEPGIRYRIEVNPPIIGYNEIEHHTVFGRLATGIGVPNPISHGKRYTYVFDIADLNGLLIPGENRVFLNQNEFTATIEGGKRKKSKRKKRTRKIK
jgi:hypothetical protein